MLPSPETVRRMVLTALLAILPLASAQATRSDVDKERRWAEQVVDGLLDGDELWLTDPTGHEFFNVLTEGENSERAIVLVHGIGVHPNWPDVIYPLRAGLLEDGLTTLSVQMPILANDAENAAYQPLFAEVPGRLDAAIDWLRAAGYRDIVLIAHSMGASMSSYYLARGKPEAVSSVVLIGMSPGIDDRNVANLARITVPVLDLYGEEDLETVVQSAAQRAAAAADGGVPGYRQVVGSGADHFWQGEESLLLEQVRGWLGRD